MHQPFIKRWTMAAGTVGLVACSEPVAPPANAPEENIMALDTQSTLAALTVIADVPLRLEGSAFGDSRTRTWFRVLIDSLSDRVEDGRLEAARRLAEQAMFALADAAKHDPDGVGDADRAAIALALEETTQRLSTARPRAARGVR